MENFKKNKLTTLTVSSLLSFMIANSAFAEDLEIYMGSSDKDTNVNILFMLDTSGSMEDRVSGTYDTRMEQAKKALKEVINQLPGDMRVGFGRFNDPGGSILTPARRLDDKIDVDINKGVDDDAYENSESKDVNVESTELVFNTASGDGDYIFEDSMENAEQCSNGSNYWFTNQYVTLGFNHQSNCFSYQGFLIKDVKVPQGAKLMDARLSLSAVNQSDSVKSRFFYEDTSSPKDFPQHNVAGNNESYIYNRNLHETNIIWSPPRDTNFRPDYFNPTRVDSPNLAPILQKIIDRPDWNSGVGKNTLNLYLKSDYYLNHGYGYNQYYSSDYWNNPIANHKPILKLSFKGTGQPNLVGIKFDNVNAASDAHVSKGLLKLIASQYNGTGTLKIQVEKGKSNKTFEQIKQDISNRQLETYSIEVPYKNWERGQTRLFDISSLLQKKFATADWCGGGDITLIISSSTAKAVYSLDSGDVNKPELVMQYDGGNANSCVSHDQITQIQNPEDDSYERDSGYYSYGNKNYPYKNRIYLERGEVGGFIFRNKDIPPRTKIKEAYIQITAASGVDDDENFYFDVYVKNANHYPINGFNSNYDHISNRLYNLYNPIRWKINEGVENNQIYKSPDLTRYVQQIIDSSSYANAKAEDRAIEIYLQNVGYEDFKLYSYDGSKGKSAKLVVRFEGEKSIATRSEKPMLFSRMTKAPNDSLTVRQYLLDLIDEQPAKGSTPLEGSLYEAGQYYLGKPVDYGRSRNVSQSHYSTIPYKRISGVDTYTGGKVEYPRGCSKNNLNDPDCEDIFISGDPVYKTPMTDNVCETNNIILITDGYPSEPSNYSRGNRNYFNVPLATLVKEQTGKSCYDAWSCAGNWVSYLYNTDFMPSKPGKSNILTHIVGFNQLDSAGHLRSLANKGGGVFVTSNNTQQLVNALNLVISNIMEIESTLATPGVAVNQNNRLQNLSDIYYSVFKPSVEKGWNGNLKKYRLSTQKTEIVDKFNVNAVNPDTGFFEEKTTSYWSKQEDGGNVLLGGAANNLTLNRPIYTYTKSSIPNNSPLNISENKVSENNRHLTKHLFGLPNSFSSSEFTKLLKWLRGVDVFDENLNGQFTDARKTMGDPLHSRPVLVNYNDTTNIVFVSTNEGFLHAIDADTGIEKFSFIPQELLPNSYEVFQGGSGNHIYGLDSSWVAWRHDTNKDGKIDKANGDWVYLYSGMRRGGDSFYALDVTDLNNPVLKFVKNKETDSKFANAGQTWSEPVLGRVKINGEEKVVLLFGGGYDNAYDNESYTGLRDNLGNQLYMLDAETGQVIWWASNTSSSANVKVQGMDYSIVSKPTMVDLKGDGYIDSIYLTDLSSQIIKIKFNENNNGVSTLATGKVIAKLGKSVGTTDIPNSRMMFDSIAVAPVKNGSEKFMAIVAGTGYRAHPLDKQRNDIIVMIKDKEEFGNQTIQNPITINDLADITTTLDEQLINEKMKNKQGYVIKLKEKDGQYIGEKMTGEPLIYDNQIILNTYIPNSKQGVCSPVIGYARGYRMNLFNGKPIAYNENGDLIENPDSNDRYKDNIVTGIANGSKIIYTEDGVFLLTNTKVEKIGSGGALGVHKKRWYEKQ